MANGRSGVRPRRHVASLGPRQVIGINVIGDLKADIAAFEKKVQEKVLRSGARAGALVYYAEMRMRVPVDKGDLFGSIYHWHDDKKSTATRQVYAVGPNKVKAPHWHLIEYGHWVVNVGDPATGKWSRQRLDAPVWVPPQPYIRPAWDRREAAGKAALARMRERLAEVSSGAEE